jgi:hypothetical protein
MNTALHAKRPLQITWPAAQRRNERDEVRRVRQHRVSTLAPLGTGLSMLPVVLGVAAMAAWAADLVSIDAMAAGAAWLASTVATFIGQAPF